MHNFFEDGRKSAPFSGGDWKVFMFNGYQNVVLFYWITKGGPILVDTEKWSMDIECSSYKRHSKSYVLPTLWGISAIFGSFWSMHWTSIKSINWLEIIDLVWCLIVLSDIMIVRNDAIVMGLCELSAIACIEYWRMLSYIVFFYDELLYEVDHCISFYVDVPRASPPD